MYVVEGKKTRGKGTKLTKTGSLQCISNVNSQYKRANKSPSTDRKANF